MSLQETEEQQSRSSDELRAADKENESVANKLSKELNNWRRKRSHGPRRHEDATNQSFHSGAARTIKVRGHETLVVRKTKSVVKPSSPQNSNRTNS